MSRRSIIGGVGRDQTHTLIETVRPDTEIIIEVIIITQTEIMRTRIRGQIVTGIIIRQIGIVRITGQIIIIIIIRILLITTTVLIITVEINIGQIMVTTPTVQIITIASTDRTTGITTTRAISEELITFVLTTETEGDASIRDVEASVKIITLSLIHI